MDKSLECKIMNLRAKLRAENEVSQRENHSKDQPINIVCSPRHSSGHRPKELGTITTLTKSRKQLDLPVNVLMQPKSKDSSEVDSKMKEIMKMNGILNINGKKYHTDMKDLEHLGELGNGTCGHVVKMLHKPSGTVIAVKQMRRSGNSDENKRIIMDLDVVFKSLACPYIVRYLGCFITESDVWICMELMATCFDRLLKKLQIAIPEDILGKITVATVNALHYLKESHGVIHRDVKPSNILLDEKGNVKLCDFGISGRLVDSKARTKNAGCAAYMAPERIEPPDPRKPDYDIRADVWSLGITLVELATGIFPYKDCKCDFEVLSRVLNEDPPTLPKDPGHFTHEFHSFVSSCLTKDYSQRPKYQKLLEHPFFKRYETKHVDVAAWYAKVTSISTTNTSYSFIPSSLLAVTRRQPPSSPQLSHQSRRPRIKSEDSVLNGDQSVQLSKFRPIDSPYGKVNELHLDEWDSFKFNGSRFRGVPSSLLQRKQCSSESFYIMNRNTYSNNYSLKNPNFLVLPHHHQTNQVYNNHSPGYSNDSLHRRSASLSPSRRYLRESKLFDHSSPSPVENGAYNVYSRRPLASLLKSQQKSVILDVVHRRSPPMVPTPPPPSPPPRLNRIPSGVLPSLPMMSRQTLYNSPSSPSTMRRLFTDGSPSLSRRILSCPPQAPPRRLSESNSVPVSPQHFMNFQQNDLIRNTLASNRFQMTPQPQRKTMYPINDL